MASVGTLVRVEIAKLVRRPMTWILALIYAAFMGLVYLAYLLLLVGDEIEGMDKQDIKDLVYLPDGLGFGLGLATSIATTSMIILAAGSFGSEFGWGTIRTVLLMRVERMRLFIAKVVVLEGFALVAVIAGAVGAVAGAVILGAAGGDGPATSAWLTAAFAGDLLLYSLRAWIAIAIWTLIAAEVAILTHSLGISIGATLAAYIVGDITTSLLDQAGKLGEYVSRLLPNAGINALLRLNSADAPTYVATDYLWIATNLVIWAGVATTFAVLRFRSMNILAASTPG